MVNLGIALVQVTAGQKFIDNLLASCHRWSAVGELSQL
jgi:hypothetical protein